MIYELLRDWFNNSVIAGLNAGIEDPDKLREIDTTLDTGFTPTSLKDKAYLIKFGAIEPENTEANVYRISITIEFLFLIAKRSIGNYQGCIDTYLFPLLDSLWSKEHLAYSNDEISEDLGLDDIDNLKLSGLDKTDKGGTYLNPEISFEITFVKN